MRMTYDAFADLAFAALDDLPDPVLAWLDNVEVVVEDWPSRAQLRSAGVPRGETLFGLYEGVPLTERTSDYGMVLPDKVTLFRGPILDACDTPAEVADEVRRTVIHELAHHFGIDDERLIALDKY
ncbi:hypothetical protein DCC79_04215 [bacterium]|nr:MAG: hypothetical protein DCC79_04215 [bacterium]